MSSDLILTSASEVSPEYRIVSFYNFMNLSEEQLFSFISKMKSAAHESDIRGLVISAREGFNGTVASSIDGIESFVSLLREIDPSADWKFKHSSSSCMPFKRFSVKVREEIVTSGFSDLKPDQTDDTHISCEEWHELMQSDEEYVLIDVRNDYEVEIGKFKNAIDPKTRDFKEFPEFVEKSGIPKDAQILMYCTGGIRCEKASLEMKNLGYSRIKQLDGGILRYIEKYPNQHFEGECFVFDDRVALDQNLQPSKNHSLCPHCGNTASDVLSCKNCGKSQKVCLHCQEKEERKTCSKNCRYHYSLALGIRSLSPKKKLSHF